MRASRPKHPIHQRRGQIPEARACRNLSLLAKNRPDVFGDRDALLAALDKGQSGGDEPERLPPETKRQRT